MPAELPKIYFIPGLGADARMFQLLQLDPDRYETVVLEWLPPRKNEPLSLYARRMADQIPTNESPVMLVGVSFGGMIAVELAKILQPARTVIISSLKTSTELPGYLKFFGRSGIHRYLPLSWFKRWRRPLEWVFGADTPMAKKLLAEIIRDTDVRFARWAFTAIITWQNTSIIPNLLHLHGNQDRIFPLTYVQQPIVYEGGHLLIFSAVGPLCSIISQEANRIFYNDSSTI